MSIPQRSYVYLAAFVSFAILLQGAYGLATDIVRLETLDMATWIAMIIVGLPVWFGHDFLGGRAVLRHPDEAGSALRKLYVNGALALAALYVFAGALYVVQDLAGDFDGLAKTWRGSPAPAPRPSSDGVSTVSASFS